MRDITWNAKEYVNEGETAESIYLNLNMCLIFIHNIRLLVMWKIHVWNILRLMQSGWELVNLV